MAFNVSCLNLDSIVGGEVEEHRAHKKALMDRHAFKRWIENGHHMVVVGGNEYTLVKVLRGNNENPR